MKNTFEDTLLAWAIRDTTSGSFARPKFKIKKIRFKKSAWPNICEDFWKSLLLLIADWNHVDATSSDILSYKHNFYEIRRHGIISAFWFRHVKVGPAFNFQNSVKTSAESFGKFQSWSTRRKFFYPQRLHSFQW